jgi:hypothetical protein
MRFSCLIAAAMVAHALPAFAQAGASTGFALGDKSRLHVELALGLSFEANPVRNDSAVNPISDNDGRFYARPGLSLDVPGSLVQLGLATHATITQFFGLSDFPRKNTFIGADATLNFGLGTKRSVIGFDLSDTFIRTPTYFDQNGAISADEIRQKQWSNNGVARVKIRPGGGALEFDVGYSNKLSLYDDLDKSMQHGALLEARYRFLPKTAILFHADFTVFDLVGTKDPTQPDTNPSTPYNITLGVLGQVTARISANLNVGFGDSLTWVGDTFSDLSPTNRRTVIGDAGVKYQFADASHISVDYIRSIVPIIQLDNYVSDLAKLGLQLGFFGRLIIAGFAGYEHRDYGVEDRAAHLFVGDARVTFWFIEYLNAAVNYRVQLQAADDNTVGSIFLEDYTKHQIFVSLGLRY